MTDTQTFGRIIVCDRCGRDVHPWPARRPDSCAPAHWQRCIRDPWENGAVREGFTVRPIGGK